MENKNRVVGRIPVDRNKIKSDGPHSWEWQLSIVMGRIPFLDMKTNYIMVGRIPFLYMETEHEHTNYVI